jgi:hypothetical protein
MKPCSCTSHCCGQDHLADGFVCCQANPGIHRQLMQLPADRTCGDCVHGPRCFAMGCSWPTRTECDFYPNLFIRAQMP